MYLFKTKRFISDVNEYYNPQAYIYWNDGHPLRTRVDLMPLMRIPYTAPLPAPTIYPASASTIPGAVAALYEFLTAPSSTSGPKNGKTVLLTGAGISVASGLADYRGTNGTYTLNKTYRPVYYHEFCANHEARKRYWARSYLGWTNLHKSKPNAAHHAVARLGEMGHLSSVITQSTCQTFT